MSEMLAFTGIFIGVLLRTILPYLRKAAESEEPLEWNHRYTLTAIVSVITSFMVAVVAFQGFEPPEGSIFLVRIQALAYAFTGAGVNSFMNEVSQWLVSSPITSKEE